MLIKKMKQKETKNRWRAGILFFILAAVILCPLTGRKVWAAEEMQECSIAIPISVEVKSDTGNIEPEKFEYGMESMDESPAEVRFASIDVDKVGVIAGRFEAVSYTRPGDYKYRVYQFKGDNKDMLYDTSIYEVTVRVLNTEDGGLNAKVWAVRNESEEKVDEIKFINKHKETTQATTEEVRNTTHHTTTNTITRSFIGSSSPKTGDRSNLLLWSVAAIVSLACIFLFILAGRKRKLE